jgi:large subunit ribosomal protein L24
MKTKFNKSWQASKQPRKQRKFRANAPLNIKKKFISVNLSKELRKKYEMRNVVVRRGDVVKIMRGKFKGQKGKVTIVRTKQSRVAIENIQVKKLDGSKVNVFMQPSNLQILELNLEDKKRMAKMNKDKKTEEKGKKETPKKEVSDDKLKTKDKEKAK